MKNNWKALSKEKEYAQSVIARFSVRKVQRSMLECENPSCFDFFPLRVALSTRKTEH